MMIKSTINVLCVSLLLVSSFTSCNPEFEEVIEWVYISHQTVKTDPETGAVRVIQHNYDDQIVLRIDQTMSVIEVFNPISGSVLYHYSSQEIKREIFCDSLTTLSVFAINEKQSMVMATQISGFELGYIFTFQDKELNDQFNCNEITYFNLIDKLD
jgi:hypothetical protein